MPIEDGQATDNQFLNVNFHKGPWGTHLLQIFKIRRVNDNRKDV